MEKSQLPATGLVLAGVYIALDRIIVYIGHIMNPPQTELGYLAELVTGGFLVVAGGLVLLGIYAHRQNQVAIPSAVLVGTVITLLTFELRLYTRLPRNQSDFLIWLLVTIPPTVGTWAILRSSNNS